MKNSLTRWMYFRAGNIYEPFLLLNNERINYSESEQLPVKAG
jgi:hypothetical protein